MKTAHLVQKIFVLTLGLMSAVLIVPSTVLAAAGSSNVCNPGADCTVGEYLYDDTYTPITAGASCTIDSKYPNGSSFLSSAAMTGAADGWYSYDFTAPATTGYYRTSVCCTVPGGDYMCIDKDFEVSESTSPTSNDIASAVWSYSSRTLSSFGSLVSSIWSSATRTLTHSTLNSGNLATQSDVNTAKDSVNNNVDTLENSVNNLNVADNTTINNNITNLTNLVKENNTLLEKSVNKPVIEAFLDDSVEVDFDVKLEGTKTIADRLYGNTNTLSSALTDIRLNWYKLSEDEISKRVSDMVNLVGDKDRTQSIYADVACFSDNWDWTVNTKLDTQTRAIKSNILLLSNQMGQSGKTYSSRARLTSTLSLVSSLKAYIGDPSDSSLKSTLYGTMKKSEETAAKIDEQIAGIDKFLESWNGIVDSDGISSIKGLVAAVSKLNKIPNVSNLLVFSLGGSTDSKTARNNLLDVRGIADSNKKLLALAPGKTLKNFWTAEGSVIFKLLITNPSKKVNQDAHIEYFLPPEVKDESDIISVDEPLAVKYSIEKNQYYVEGNVPVVAGTSSTVSIRIKDLWVITDTELDALSEKAAELLIPLEKTSFYAQGLTLKSAIDEDVAKVKDLAKSATTPLKKIKNYREIMSILGETDEKLTGLTGLVTQASSMGTLFGFIGGTQSVAV